MASEEPNAEAEGFKAPQTIGLVWGYLPGIDVQSKRAADAELGQRFSLAFNRYPDSAPEMFIIEFDRELVVNALERILQLFPHDSLSAEDSRGASHASLLEACLPEEDEGDYDTLYAIRLFQGDELVCYVEHELYQAVGGPSPYHDAYVYAFYCKNAERDVVQNALFDHATKNNILIADVVSGYPEPYSPPWWRRWFG